MSVMRSTYTPTVTFTGASSGAAAAGRASAETRAVTTTNSAARCLPMGRIMPPVPGTMLVVTSAHALGRDRGGRARRPGRAAGDRRVPVAAPPRGDERDRALQEARRGLAGRHRLRVVARVGALGQD